MLLGIYDTISMSLFTWHCFACYIYALTRLPSNNQRHISHALVVLTLICADVIINLHLCQYFNRSSANAS